MVTRYGQADVPREVSGRGGPAVRPAAADFPRDICLTVSRNHAVFLLYEVLPLICVNRFVCMVSQKQKREKLTMFYQDHTILRGHFNTVSYQYRNSHDEDKMVSCLSYFVATNLYLQSFWLHWSEALMLTVQLYYNWYFMHYRDVAWAPGISSHWQLDSLLISLFRWTSKKTSNLCISCALRRKSIGDLWIPWKRAYNDESIFISCHHHGVHGI